MKTIPRIVITVLLLAMGLPCVYAQGTSNKGTEFWTAWMDHIDGTGSAMSLYITGDNTTTGTVSSPVDGSFSIPFTVTANQVTIVDIPVSAYLATEGSYDKGIHITSDQNIVVYAHIYHNNRSGATLVLPVNAMGKDYYSLNFTQVGNGNPTENSTFCVIATEDATTVEITPTQLLSSGHIANTVFTVTLAKKGQLYQALSAKDLTGTRIKSVSSGTETCKKIAVYSGSSFDGIACASVNPGSGDNLFQQVYPTASWGKNFVTAPLSNRPYDIYRIVYSDPTAQVTLNGTLITAAQLTNNLYYQFSSTVTNVISSDKPIQVVQYAVTQGTTIDCKTVNNDVGDPEMIFLTPIEQGLDHVTLYSTDKQNITQSYINVIIPTSAASSFILDGAPYTNFKVVTGTSYSYAQIKVASGPVSGTHNISASSPFSAIAYGFGNVESYGYAAGTDLKNLNEFIELDDPATSTALSTGCTGAVYKPRLNIPYQTTKITWDLKDGSTPLVVNNPILKGTTVKGTQTLYIYEYPNTVTYPTSGSYSIVATVLNPTADDCGSNEDIEFDYTISDVPGAKFTIPATSCPGDAITFTDQTDTKGVATKTWAWDFGDPANATAANPNTAATQNSKYTYTKPGDYTAQLTITNINGCATSAQQNIHVNAVPKASFTASTPDCETRTITFTDTSTPGDGTNAQWAWDFGDASNSTVANPNTATTQNTQHTYQTPGTYTVSLTVTSSTGCVSDVYTQAVVISPLPIVDFTLPDVCTNDTYAQFTNKTTISDNSDALMTYKWDFGDAVHATVTNPNASTLANPQHSYHFAGNYQVTLTATSKNGCTVIKSQSFTVNGDTPKAAFTVENSGSLCSSEDVIFDDQSTVNYGNITKIVWYFDAVNHPNDATVYTKDQFPADGKFHHNYGLFYTPATQNYAVKMEAYSGGSCVNVAAIQTITVKANPSVILSQIGPLCKEIGPVQITQTVNNGVAGNGVFSGTGVSATGLFDPAVSGAGTFTINYVFTATNGCDYSTSGQVTVYDTPKADGGGDLHMLEGGQITINATASGDMPLTYKWTLASGAPATNLDHDDVLTPIASPKDDISYRLTVTSVNNCTATSIVNITVLKAPVVPNTFTPNNDGTNDTWEIKYLESYPNCTIDVYNRYGEKLYSSIGYPTAWDGTYKGAQLPVGTYYYIINPKNGRKVITGSVTIIR